MSPTKDVSVLQCYITFLEVAYGGFFLLLFIFKYQHTESCLFTSYLKTFGDILFVDNQIYIPTSQTDFIGVIQHGLVDIQLNSGDQVKQCPLLFRHLFSISQSNFSLVILKRHS